jgi:hypothetical protein
MHMDSYLINRSQHTCACTYVPHSARLALLLHLDQCKFLSLNLTLLAGTVLVIIYALAKDEINLRSGEFKGRKKV